ncbi:restriction endonuclease subunit S [Deinococcus aestuarii]|uniref:restriction endonuclease subunit S n=1 Tax=Deinococcus aestuarii TaxID=2774531 RepID=UPI001C0B7E0C|nr:restriction endonuclease subunit S [Deinococcus aestuarii]
MIQKFSVVSVNDVIDVNNGQSLTATERKLEGTYAVYAAGGRVGWHDKALTTSPFAVIGRKGSAGKVTFAPTGGWVIDTAYYAVPKESGELDPQYMAHALAALDFSEDIISTAIPGINRTAIYRHQLPLPPLEVQKVCAAFLDAIDSNSEVPSLPPLPEQRRIVARVKGMLAKVEEARGLAAERDRGARHLLTGVFYSLTENAPIKTLAEVAPLVRRPVEVREGEIYPELGVRSFGRGTFHKPALSAIEVGDKKLFRIEEGDLLFNIVFAWEGAVAIAKAEDRGRVGSHRFLTCVTDKGQAEASFLNFYFQTAEGLAALGEASPGGAGRNRTLSLKNLAALAVPVPPLESQRYFQRLLEKVETVYSQQANLAPELDALPASILARAFAGEL